MHKKLYKKTIELLILLNITFLLENEEFYVLSD
jgi:hypothetical protein